MASRASIRSSLKVISIPSSSVGAKLQPQRIRASLSFAGLYQITHEMIKQSVLEEVRLFYRQGFDETGWQYDEEEYKRPGSERRAQGSVQSVSGVAWRIRGHQAGPG